MADHRVHRSAVHHEDGPDSHERDQQQADRAVRRAVVFEEALRAATALMVVVFGVSVVTAFPFVPVWVFPAALGGVLLSVPAAVFVRLHEARPGELRSTSGLWGAALVGVSTFALTLTLLLVIAQVVALGSALTRLAGVLAALAVIAWLRGWRPFESEPVTEGPSLGGRP